MSLYLPNNITPLGGHTSGETAYVIESYPYGGMRTKMRVWVETRAKFGQRFVSQTLNPKTGRWNKPHAGNYSPLICIFINKEKGEEFVEHTVLSVWCNKRETEAFECVFGNVMDEKQKSILAEVRAANIRQSPVSYFEFNKEQEEEYKEKITALNESVKGLAATPENKKMYKEKKEQIIKEVINMK